MIINVKKVLRKETSADKILFLSKLANEMLEQCDIQVTKESVENLIGHPSGLTALCEWAKINKTILMTLTQWQIPHKGSSSRGKPDPIVYELILDVQENPQMLLEILSISKSEIENIEGV